MDKYITTIVRAINKIESEEECLDEKKIKGNYFIKSISKVNELLFDEEIDDEDEKTITEKILILSQLFKCVIFSLIKRYGVKELQSVLPKKKDTYLIGKIDFKSDYTINYPVMGFLNAMYNIEDTYSQRGTILEPIEWFISLTDKILGELGHKAVLDKILISDLNK